MPQSRALRALLCLIVAVLIGAGAPVGAAAQDTTHAGGNDAYQHGFENPERYADDWNDPARDEWQKPGAIIEAMGVESGMTVADLGAGTGYFVPHLSEAVGEDGTVLAVDIEPAMLRYVAEMAEKRGLTNVDTIRAAPDDSHLRPSSVDRVLTVNVWHHIPNRAVYVEHLATRLANDGALWVVDFEQEAPMGPPKQHRLEPHEIISELEAGGMEAEVRELGLPHQFVVVGRPR